MRWFSPACLAVLGAAALMIVLTGCTPGSAPGGPVVAAAAPTADTATPRADEPWGTIKGKAVWAGTDDEAKPVAANIDKDQAVCLKNGPIYKSDYVVNPKNKGVRWVVVWLVDANDYKKELPIKPDLKEPKDKTVVLDQPCCQFVPHIVAMREGQDLEIKNSGTIPHNTKIDSPGDNPSINPLLPPGSSQVVPGWKASVAPSTVGCSIHGWMTAYIKVFNNPYFAVTDEDGNFTIKDAPAGKYHIVAWQETIGFLSKTYKKGDPIDIKPNAVTEVKFEVKPKPAG